MGETNSGKISLKLLVDRKENRVIFGEAGKDFVDFLFHFLSLPVGTVVKLLTKNKMVGSLGKIYESIETMNANYMEPNVNKDHVLNPKVGNTPFLLGNKSNADDQQNETMCFYKCNRGCSKIASDQKVSCTSCGRQMTMNLQMTYIESPENEAEAAKIGKGGYVKELVNYMVMDNLVVKPMSTISSITLLSNVKDMTALETLEVYIGKNEAVDLLKASFVTDKVLTSLFLGKQNSYQPGAYSTRSRKGF